MIFFDVETLDFFGDPAFSHIPRMERINHFRFGVGVTLTDTENARYESVWDLLENDDVARIWLDATALWGYLLDSGEVVVGWNTLKFDYPITSRAAAADPARLPPTCDLFDVIRRLTGRWYKLGVIAECNGVGSKSADGQTAAEWLRAGRYDLAASYCELDVRLTRALYYRALTDGLLLPPRTERGEDAELRLFRSEGGWHVA